MKRNVADMGEYVQVTGLWRLMEAESQPAHRTYRQRAHALSKPVVTVYLQPGKRPVVELDVIEGYGRTPLELTPDGKEEVKRLFLSHGATLRWNSIDSTFCLVRVKARQVAHELACALARLPGEMFRPCYPAKGKLQVVPPPESTPR